MKFGIALSAATSLLAFQANARFETITAGVPTKVLALPTNVFDNALASSSSITGSMNQGLIDVESQNTGEFTESTTQPVYTVQDITIISAASDTATTVTALAFTTTCESSITASTLITAGTDEALTSDSATRSPISPSGRPVGSGSGRLSQTTITITASQAVSSYTGDSTQTVIIDASESSTGSQAPNAISIASFTSAPGTRESAATAWISVTEVEIAVTSIPGLEESAASSSVGSVGFESSSVITMIFIVPGLEGTQRSSSPGNEQGAATVSFGTPSTTAAALLPVATSEGPISSVESSLPTTIALFTFIPVTLASDSEGQSGARAGAIVIVPTLSENSLGVPTIVPSGIEVSQSNGGSNFGSVETGISISSSAIGMSISIVQTTAASSDSMTRTLTSTVYPAITMTAIVAPNNTLSFQSITSLNRNSTFLTTTMTNTRAGVNGVSQTTETVMFSSLVPIGPSQSSMLVTTATVVLPTEGTSVTGNGSVGSSSGSNGSLSGGKGGSALVPGSDFSSTNSETYLVPSGTRSPVKTGKATKLGSTSCVGLVVIIAALL